MSAEIAKTVFYIVLPLAGLSIIAYWTVALVHAVKLPRSGNRGRERVRYVRPGLRHRRRNVNMQSSRQRSRRVRPEVDLPFVEELPYDELPLPPV